MLQNAHFLAKIGADTAENEQRFAEILPTDTRHAAAALPSDAIGSPAANSSTHFRSIRDMPSDFAEWPASKK